MEKVKSALIVLLVAVLGWLGYDGFNTEPPIIEPPVVIIDTTTVDTVITPSYDLIIGVTAGAETVDHLDDAFEMLEQAPATLRWYYHQDKDIPKNATPSQFEYVPHSLIDLVNLDWSNDYHKVSNFYRAQSMREKLPNTHFIVSTEIALRPDGSYSKFDNRNWLYEQWGSDTKIREFVRFFIANNNSALGIGTWTWQLSSEPWDPDWTNIQRAYIAEWRATPEDIRPQLMTPAIPIGQDDGREGINKWWAEHDLTIDDYIPSDLRDAYSILAMHGYPLKNGEWINDPDLVLAKAEYAVKLAVRWGIPGVAITETGAPYNMPWINDYYASILPALDAMGVSEVYLYNYRQQRSPGKTFDDCYLQSPTGAYTKAWELVTGVE